MIPETVSELEGAVSIALSQKRPWVECAPEVIDCILRSEDWKKQGYIIYRNMRVYGIGLREESQRREGLTGEAILFANSAGPGPETMTSPKIKIEGIDT